MPAEVEIRIAPDPVRAADYALNVFRREVEAGVRSRGRAGVAISGGKSPLILFERLGGVEFRDWRCWESLHVFWVDERAVDPAHRDSNYRLARQSFLERVPVPESQVHRMRGEAPDLEVEALRYARLLEFWVKEGRPRLDLVMLGLGADGHTASLFPGSPVLLEEHAWVMVAPGPKPGEKRLTLTFPVLKGSRAALFLVTGEDKAEAVSRVLAGDETVEAVPARGVRLEDGRAHWVLDRAAASRLGRPLGVPPGD